MIRILHVLGELNTGGAETMVMNLYRNIDRTKIQFDFIVHGNNVGFYEEEIKSLGGKIYRVSKYKVINHGTYVKEWNEFFKSHSEYKIIHSHVRSTASIILKIAKKYDLKTICHSHSTSNGSGLASVVKKILQKSIPKYADYLFACSKESAIWLYSSKLANTDRCYIIKNAIDSEKYRYNLEIRNSVRKKFNLNDKIVLGQVGRLTEVKNHIFTIKLLKELVKENNNYFLLIVGTGPLKDNIKQQLKENDLEDNVLILENRSDVNELLQAMDVYLMPSLWEGIPLALVEAQAASLPCVISENVLGGIIINEKVSKLSLNNVELWVAKINELVNAYEVRRDEIDKIVESGFDIKENAEIVSKFYIDLYK